jgi:hypothetical protein
MVTLILCLIFLGSSQEPRMKFHMTGIIDHTFQKRYMYLSPSTLEGGPNLTCSVLYHQLLNAIPPNTPRPKMLQIQMDNCWRENKNLTVFAFASMLVSN